MEPEIQPASQSEEPASADARGSDPQEPLTPGPNSREIRGMDWMLNGPHGLRAGWSLAIFVILFRLFSVIVGTIAVGLYPAVTKYDFSPATTLVGESVPFLAMLGAVAMVGLFEHCGIEEFNLSGPRRPLNFFSGIAAGFLALSAPAHPVGIVPSIGTKVPHDRGRSRAQFGSEAIRVSFLCHDAAARLDFVFV